MKTLYALVFVCLSLPALADVLDITPIGADEEDTVVATVPAPPRIEDQSVGGGVYFLVDEYNAGSTSDDVGAVTTPDDVGSVTTPVMDAVTTPAIDAVTTPAIDAVTTPAIDAVTAPAVDAVTAPAMDAVTAPAVDA